MHPPEYTFEGTGTQPHYWLGGKASAPLVIILNTMHAANRDNPAAFHRALLDFLQHLPNPT